MRLTAFKQPADLSTLSRQKIERVAKGEIVHRVRVQGWYHHEISVGGCDYGSIFNIIIEGLCPGRRETELNTVWTKQTQLLDLLYMSSKGTAMKVELVLYAPIYIVSLHKTAEESTGVDCFCKKNELFFYLTLAWWYSLKTELIIRRAILIQNHATCYAYFPRQLFQQMLYIHLSTFLLKRL